MSNKKIRICESCKRMTKIEYSDEEWESLGHECDDCNILYLFDDDTEDE